LVQALNGTKFQNKQKKSRDPTKVKYRWGDNDN